ncbi:dipeptide/oligopeptide/nickel ABC transporter ATP-binding protein [Actinomycetota bacterium]|nr:dipeptide/oligopeptide/nickel ABC transporter ATP-binding protein [Actinomycetota bacterium]
MTLTDTLAESVPARPTGAAKVLRRLLGSPVAVMSALVLLVLAASAVLAPMVSPHPPEVSNLADIFAPISGEHLLGGDAVGRDVLSRLLWGGRVSLLGAVLALGVALVVGVPAGLVAGFYSGSVDLLAGWVTNLLMALPSMVVLLSVRAVAGPSVWISMSVLGVLMAPSFFRLVRSAVADVRHELYIDAARVSGLSDTRIISRHVLTVVRAPIIIQSALVTGVAVAIQAGLEFLGIGDSTVPTWGNMLNDGFRNIYVQPTLLLWPALAIGLTCMALSLLGNALRDALEDRDTPPSAKASRTGPRPQDVTASDAPRTDTLLSVRNLAVSYGARTVVRDVSLDVSAGEVLGLVGESGSGKTQTAFAVLGLLPRGGTVSHGRVFVEGSDALALPTRARRALRGRVIAYIPQEPQSNLDPSFTVGSQLVEQMRCVLGISRKEARARALRYLDRVGIADPARTFASYPHEISGGMAQRVLIAAAVSCDPVLLIADEPTTALDVTVQAEVLGLLRELQQERGMGVVLVTHNLGVVADLCDRVAVMRDGEIVETASVTDLFAAPRHEYTRALLGSTLDDKPARPPLGSRTKEVTA